MTEHEKKYSEIVEAVGLNNLIPLIPATKEEVQDALSCNCYLNNIPLQSWDMQHFNVLRLTKRAGYQDNSLSFTVCVLKQAARMWAKS